MISITILIVLVTVIISVAAFSSPRIYSKFIFHPYSVHYNNEWYRFLTSGFIHADFIHLALNMFVLYQFGHIVEAYYGSYFENKGWYYYIIMYLGGILIAILPTYKKHMHDPGYHGLGASGAVSAVLFASILFDPWSKLYIFGIIGLPGIVFGPAYLLYSYYMNKRSADHINHDAHFWGAVFGVVFTIILKPTIFLNFINILFNPQ